MKKFIVTLTADERKHLAGITCKGKHRSQKLLNHRGRYLLSTLILILA